jgi:transcription initiation factor TFIIB
MYNQNPSHRRWDHHFGKSPDATRLNLFTKLSSKDCDGRNVLMSSRYYRNLDELNNRTMPRHVITMERNMRRGRYIISNITQKLQLSQMIRERATVLYRKVAKMGIAKGRSINGIATACVYLACKDAGAPRSVLEFKPLMISKDERKRFFKGYRTIVEYLRESDSEEDIPFSPALPTPPIVMNPKNEMPRMASRLPKKLTGLVVKQACNLYDSIYEIDPLYFTGKHPACIAASLLYLANQLSSNPRVTQHELSHLSGISLVSVRSRFKKCLSLLLEHGKIDKQIGLDLLKRDLPM